MAGHVLQLSFTYGGDSDRYTEMIAPLVDAFADLPGLRWKLWLINEEESEAGGIYFFESGEAVEAFAESDLARQLMNHPYLSKFQIKAFGVLEAQSVRTRGPVGAGSAPQH